MAILPEAQSTVTTPPESSLSRRRAPECPTCGERALRTTEHTRDGIVTGTYLCRWEHLFNMRWLAVSG